MKNKRIFTNPEFGVMRVMEIDGKPWFVAEDTYKVLGINSYAVRQYVPGDEVCKRTAREIGCKTGGLSRLLISGRGINTLLRHYGSKKAKAFKAWVRELMAQFEPEQPEQDVAGELIDKIITSPEFGIRLLTELQAERNRRVALEEEHKGRFADSIVGKFARWLDANYPELSA